MGFRPQTTVSTHQEIPLQLHQPVVLEPDNSDLRHACLDVALTRRRFGVQSNVLFPESRPIEFLPERLQKSPRSGTLRPLVIQSRPRDLALVDLSLGRLIRVLGYGVDFVLELLIQTVCQGSIPLPVSRRCCSPAG